MPRNKPQAQPRDPLPEDFNTLEAFWAFWDTHSAADYEDVMEDIDAHVDLLSSRSIALWRRAFSHTSASSSA